MLILRTDVCVWRYHKNVLYQNCEVQNKDPPNKKTWLITIGWKNDCLFESDQVDLVLTSFWSFVSQMKILITGMPHIQIHVGEKTAAAKNEIILINSPSFLLPPLTPYSLSHPAHNPHPSWKQTIFIFCVWQIKRVPLVRKWDFFLSNSFSFFSSNTLTHTLLSIQSC